MRRVVLLGPQRFEPSVAPALDALGCRGAVALVSAGWQEREDEIGEFADHVGRVVVPLRLWSRFERVMAEDPELATAARRFQDEMQQLQQLYRLRLYRAVDALVELLERPGDAFVEAARHEALAAVRLLDRQHVGRVRALRRRFVDAWQPPARPAVARERAELAAELGRAEALAIAGGHVAVLLNRLRLFDLGALAAHLPVVAWSAGAMVLAERIVLFHDNPPQGPGAAEVLEAGLGVCAHVVPLPHAGRRLRLDDPRRVAVFARRFAPAVCVRLDAGARLDWDGQRWHGAPGTERLLAQGGLAPLDPS